MRDKYSASYEPRDVSPKPLLYFGLALGITLMMTLLGVFAFQAFLRSHKNSETDFYFQERQTIFPEPSLEVHPGQTLQEVRARENFILESYGWVDRSQNKVRIPIENALKETAKTGLPYRKGNHA